MKKSSVFIFSMILSVFLTVGCEDKFQPNSQQLGSSAGSESEVSEGGSTSRPDQDSGDSNDAPDDQGPSPQPPAQEPPPQTPPPQEPPPQTPPPVAATLKSTVERLGFNKNVGRISTKRLKSPTTDQLPAGMVFDSDGQTMRVHGDNTVLEDWDFTNFDLLIEGKNCIVRNNIFGEINGVSGVNYYVQLAVSASGAIFEHNEFSGYPGEGGAFAAIKQLNNGSGLTVTTARNTTIRYNRFEFMNADALKVSGGDQIIEWNAFLDPINLEMVPVAWNSTKVFRQGEYSMNASGHIFKSKSNNNVGNPVPSNKGSDNFWQNLDPHVDHITIHVSVSSTKVRYNFFSSPGKADKSDRVTGMNNMIRVVRNNGKDFLYENIEIYGNYMEENSEKKSWPMQVADAGQPHFLGPVEIFGNWIGGNRNGNYVTVSAPNVYWSNNRDVITDAIIQVPNGASAMNNTPNHLAIPAIISNGFQ